VKNRNRIYVFMVFCLVLCAGCDDVEKTSYRSLSVMAVTYDGIMSSLGDAYKQGLITEDAKEKIIDVGNVFYGAYHSAEEAFKAYISAKKSGVDTRPFEDKLESSVTYALVSMNTYITYYNSIASGIEGMKEWEDNHE